MEALAGYVFAPVGLATFYHANYVMPAWAPRLAKVTQIGAHIFYRWSSAMERSLRVCALLRKPDAVRADVDISYVGFDIPNEFVVGYGLDYAERYRDLPYIGTLDPKVYEQQ